jgi:drug/metabolite transporter (DMT)-like permease
MTSRVRVVALTTIAMLAFAGNSLLCRMALKQTHIDPASFTLIRIASGALTLWLIVRWRSGASELSGNWGSALALAAYAIAFSFAYVGVTAATGALLLFGAVQVTMIGYGWWTGERLGVRRLSGLALASVGLVGLLLPGLSSPPIASAALMLAAGVAWGIYSLRGKGSGDPLRATAGNFARAAVPAAMLSAVTLSSASVDPGGAALAVASGALASGLGYAVWYGALPALKTTNAATVQLSVPVIAALGGIVVLDESLTLRIVLASAVILGGIALVVTGSGSQRAASPVIGGRGAWWRRP